jgi:hypothetical protein
MVISRSQMTRQLEPGLGNSWRGKQKKKASAVYVKKPNPIAKNLSNRLFSSKVVHSKKLYNRKKERNTTLKAAANKGE